MNIRIRLAERRGLLTGPHLSRVQEAALYYCLLEDKMQASEARGHQLKMAMVSSGHVELTESNKYLIPLAKLFAEETTVDDDSAPLADDETSVTYKFSEEQELSPEEMERELMALIAGGEMTVNGGEFDGP